MSVRVNRKQKPHLNLEVQRRVFNKETAYKIGGVFGNHKGLCRNLGTVGGLLWIGEGELTESWKEGVV